MTELDKLLAKGQVAQALTQAEQILSKAPNGPDARNALITLARIALVKGQLKEAEGLTAKAEAKGTSPETMLLRANLHGQKGELEQAEKFFHQALQQNPKFAEAHFGRGLMLAKTGRMAEAVGCFEQANALSPRNPVFQYRLAQALLEEDRVEEAVANFEGALTLNPKFLPAYLSLSQALARGGDLPSARRIIERGLKTIPHHPRLLAALTNLSLIQGDLRTSQKTATELANKRVDDPDAQANLALILLLQGKRKDAFFIAQRLASLGKSNAQLKMVEATYYEGEEPPQYEKAVRAYEEAMAADVNGWRAPNNLGQLLMRMDDPERVGRAVTVLEEAHRRKPDQLEPMLNLALAYLKAEEREKSLTLTKRLLTYGLPDKHPIRDQAKRLEKVLTGAKA